MHLLRIDIRFGAGGGRSTSFLWPFQVLLVKAPSCLYRLSVVDSSRLASIWYLGSIVIDVTILTNGMIESFLLLREEI